MDKFECWNIKDQMNYHNIMSLVDKSNVDFSSWDKLPYPYYCLLVVSQQYSFSAFVTSISVTPYVDVFCLFFIVPLILSKCANFDAGNTYRPTGEWPLQDGKIGSSTSFLLVFCCQIGEAWRRRHGKGITPLPKVPFNYFEDTILSGSSSS